MKYVYEDGWNSSCVRIQGQAEELVEFTDCLVDDKGAGPEKLDNVISSESVSKREVPTMSKKPNRYSAESKAKVALAAVAPHALVEIIDAFQKRT